MEISAKIGNMSRSYMSDLVNEKNALKFDIIDEDNVSLGKDLKKIVDSQFKFRLVQILNFRF